MQTLGLKGNRLRVQQTVDIDGAAGYAVQPVQRGGAMDGARGERRAYASYRAVSATPVRWPPSMVGS